MKEFIEMIKEDKLGKLLTVSIIFFIIILLLPYFLTRTWFTIADFTKTGEIGDTIGGISSPFLAIVVAYLTFFAFWVQFKFNKRQKLDIERERFETKFFEMIKIHRENINEISIKNGLIKNRKAFIHMFNEFKYGYYLINHINLHNKNTIENYQVFSEEQLSNLAYLVFFYGVGPNSSDLSLSLIKESNEKILLKQFISKIESIRSSNWQKDTLEINTYKATNDIYRYNPKYKPFGGHMTRLGHYYRNLFQIISFVDSQPDDIIENKYDYIKILRSQISSYEQLLLFYNSLSILGKPWWNNNYLIRYKLLRNIPLSRCDFGVNIKSLISELDESGKLMFEWDEIRSSYNSRN